jgi:hypothetical protein
VDVIKLSQYVSELPGAPLCLQNSFTGVYSHYTAAMNMSGGTLKTPLQAIKRGTTYFPEIISFTLTTYINAYI